ncbi:large subunit ribosomal protein L13 [Mycoplasmoides fastidiosum]|uniref:Large ribosomal subunit protein uL13 n=2 Tax=Mycoplasmoides fastidiosum TaxID=92758 RepID=A0ABU0LZ07_9BACT|nr:large subunit ribosomal protein L13 [Mycoplasmoides fastidiosum]UUD37651.1 50S ribosomal protein L13 [Mycoplasmoides fastidiosum]
MKTTMLTKEQALKRRKWYVIDAKDQILGRLSVEVANLLRGKNRPDFTPNQDCGDFVIVINAGQIRLSGNKAENERWYRHSGYVGGLKSRTGKEMIEKKPVEFIRKAVKGMLPKNNSLSLQLMHKLFVYENDNHKHQAQEPIIYRLNGQN